MQGAEQCGEEEKSEFGFQLAELQILLWFLKIIIWNLGKNLAIYKVLITNHIYWSHQVDEMAPGEQFREENMLTKSRM